MQLDPRGSSFPKLINDTILKAANGEKTNYVPVWFMRQAGRYLPEFMELRKRYSFFEICFNPELACQVTMMPNIRFDLDASIIFSDILVVIKALGIEVLIENGVHIPNPLKLNEEWYKRLNVDVNLSQELRPLYDAITLTRHQLKGKCPLIGFAGSPMTLMLYMTGCDLNNFPPMEELWFILDATASHQLLDLLSTKIVEHLVEQVKAGAQMLQLFDSYTNRLTIDVFKTFVCPYIFRICTQVKNHLRELKVGNVPIIIFTKGSKSEFISCLLDGSEGVFEVLSLDWSLDPKEIRKLTSRCLQGNLAPSDLTSTPEEVIAKTEAMVKSFGCQSYIANLGHGITPDAKIDCVQAFIETIHKTSKALNNQG